MKINMLVTSPKISPIKIPFLFITLAVIKADKNKLIAPKTVEIWVIKVGDMLEYKTTMLKAENKIAKITIAIKRFRK